MFPFILKLKPVKTVREPAFTGRVYCIELYIKFKFMKKLVRLFSQYVKERMRT